MVYSIFYRTVYSTVYRSFYSRVYRTVYSTVYRTAYGTVKWSLCLWCWFIALPRMKMKISSMKKKINHQNDVKIRNGHKFFHGVVFP